MYTESDRINRFGTVDRKVMSTFYYESAGTRIFLASPKVAAWCLLMIIVNTIVRKAFLQLLMEARYICPELSRTSEDHI